MLNLTMEHFIKNFALNYEDVVWTDESGIAVRNCSPNIFLKSKIKDRPNFIYLLNIDVCRNQIIIFLNEKDYTEFVDNVSDNSITIRFEINIK